jgi:hypothetical protein
MLQNIFRKVIKTYKEKRTFLQMELLSAFLWLNRRYTYTSRKTFLCESVACFCPVLSYMRTFLPTKKVNTFINKEYKACSI